MSEGVLTLASDKETYLIPRAEITYIKMNQHGFTVATKRGLVLDAQLKANDVLSLGSGETFVNFLNGTTTNFVFNKK